MSVAAVDLVISTRWRARWGWRSPSRCRRCRCRSGRNRTAAGCARTTSGTYQGWPERRLDQGHLPRVVRRLRPQRLHPQPPRRPQGHRGLPRRRRGLRRGRRLVGDRHPARRARMRGLSTSDEPVRAAGRCAGGGPAVDWSLTFPDLPRLELDQLLGQVVARAREVLARHPGSVAGAVAGHPDGVRGSGVAGGVAADRGGGPGPGGRPLRGAGDDRPGRAAGRIRTHRNARAGGEGHRAPTARQRDYWGR